MGLYNWASKVWVQDKDNLALEDRAALDKLARKSIRRIKFLKGNLASMGMALCCSVVLGAGLFGGMALWSAMPALAIAAGVASLAATGTGIYIFSDVTVKIARNVQAGLNDIRAAEKVLDATPDAAEKAREVLRMQKNADLQKKLKDSFDAGLTQDTPVCRPRLRTLPERKT